MAQRGVSQTFRAFKNRNYLLFWCGQVVSQIGTWMQRIGQAWLVLQITNSPLALGVLTGIQFAPVLLFSLFAGVLADRLPKRRLLIITQSIMLVQAAVLTLLTATHHINLTSLYILAAVLGVASAADNPTRQAFVSELVGPEDVPNAVALNSAQFNTARLVGPGLGGLAIAAFGVAGCVLLNSVSFVAVLIGLVLMRPAEFHGRERIGRGNMFRQVWEGLRYGAQTPDLALIVILLAILGTFGYNFTVVLPLIAVYVLHSSSIGFGALTSTMAVGSLLAAGGIAYSGQASRRLLLAGGIGFTISLLGVGLSHWWIMTIPMVVLLGLFSIAFQATANTRMQLVSPPAYRGRVMSIYTLLFAGTTPIGSIIVGFAAEHGGVQWMVIEMAVMCGVGVAVGALYLSRSRDRMLVES